MGRRSSPAAQERLVRTVEQLQAEVEGLRQAMRARALIEQADATPQEFLNQAPDQPAAAQVRRLLNSAGGG